MKPSYFTEAYIKTNLQEHIKEEVSTISIRSKYKLMSNEGVELQEYNFVEYKDKTYFVMTFKDLANENPNIVILNKEECKKLLTGIVEIVLNAISTPPIENNIEYFDYVFGAMNHSTTNGWFPPAVGDACRMCSFTAQCPAFGGKDFPLQIPNKGKEKERN